MGNSENLNELAKRCLNSLVRQHTGAVTHPCSSVAVCSVKTHKCQVAACSQLEVIIFNKTLSVAGTAHFYTKVYKERNTQNFV